MKPSKQFLKAIKHKDAMDAALEPLNALLRELLFDDDASLFCQSGDGWCVLFNNAHNAPLQPEELDQLLAMSREDAARGIKLTI